MKNFIKFETTNGFDQNVKKISFHVTYLAKLCTNQNTKGPKFGTADLGKANFSERQLQRDSRCIFEKFKYGSEGSNPSFSAKYKQLLSPLHFQ